MVNKKYITYEQYNQQIQHTNNLRLAGMEFIHTKSKIKIGLGCVCLTIAIIPNGLGFIFYPLGFSLLASGGIDTYALLRKRRDKLRSLWSTLTRKVRR